LRPLLKVAELVDRGEINARQRVDQIGDRSVALADLFVIFLNPLGLVFQMLKDLWDIRIRRRDVPHQLIGALIRLDEVVQSLKDILIKVPKGLVLGIRFRAPVDPMRDVARIEYPAD